MNQRYSHQIKELADYDFPQEFICPISQIIMVDPVFSIQGNTFERKQIEAWIERYGSCPLTRQPLSKKDLKPNRALRDTIIKYVENLSTKQKQNFQYLNIIEIARLRQKEMQDLGYTTPQPQNQNQYKNVKRENEILKNELYIERQQKQLLKRQCEVQKRRAALNQKKLKQCQDQLNEKNIILKQREKEIAILQQEIKKLTSVGLKTGQNSLFEIFPNILPKMFKGNRNQPKINSEKQEYIIQPEMNFQLRNASQTESIIGIQQLKPTDIKLLVNMGVSKELEFNMVKFINCPGDGQQFSRENLPNLLGCGHFICDQCIQMYKNCLLCKAKIDVVGIKVKGFKQMVDITHAVVNKVGKKYDFSVKADKGNGVNPFLKQLSEEMTLEQIIQACPFLAYYASERSDKFMIIINRITKDYTNSKNLKLKSIATETQLFQSLKGTSRANSIYVYNRRS